MLGNLPAEILQEITQYVSETYQDRLSLSLVNRKMYQDISNIPYTRTRRLLTLGKLKYFATLDGIPDGYFVEYFNKNNIKCLGYYYRNRFRRIKRYYYYGWPFSRADYDDEGRLHGNYLIYHSIYHGIVYYLCMYNHGIKYLEVFLLFDKNFWLIYRYTVKNFLNI